MQILRKICARIERKSIPGVNWIRTLYFNFRMLPFKQAIKLPFYIYGKPVFNSLLGKIVFKCPIKKGMVKINQVLPYAPSLQTINSQILIGGTLYIGGYVTIGCGTKIIVANDAILELGNYTKITDFCNIDCCKHITIGDGTSITHRCQLMDSNHHYIVNMNNNNIPNNTYPIHIGKHCWVCNSSTIALGTKLPDYSIVASNSLVNKDFSSSGENIFIGGMPAKLIKSNIFRVYDDNIEIMLNEYFNQTGESCISIRIEDIHLYKNLYRNL